MGKGKIKAISISKTKNARLIIKNRIEKGLRKLCAGSKPHSNGVIVSGVWLWLYFNINPTTINNRVNKIGHKNKFIITIFLLE